MPPLQVAGRRVDRFDYVVRLGHVQHAAVGERRSLLPPGRKPARPDHPQLVHVLAVDLVQRAVAPPVERPAPAQPVFRRRVLEHRVGDGDERGGRLRGHDDQAGGQRQHRNGNPAH